MNRGTLRALVKSGAGGALNLTDAQVNVLIDQAVRSIAALLTPDRAPRLVKRSSLNFALNRNTGFEITDGTDADGWVRSGNCAIDNTIANTGTYSAKFVTDATGLLVSELIPLVPAKTYSWKMYARHPVGLDQPLTFGLRLYGADQQQVNSSLAALTITSTSFTEVVGSSSFVPAATELWGRIEVDMGTFANQVNIDDVRLTCAGQARLPDDALGLPAMIYIDDIPARVVTPEQTHELTQNTNVFLAGTTASPLVALEGAIVRYSPTAAVKVEALYIVNPPSLVTDGSEPMIPVDLHDMIMPNVAYWGALANGQYEEASRHYAAFGAMAQRAGLQVLPPTR